MQILEEINNLISDNNNKKKQINELDVKIEEINKEIETKEKDLEISQNAINLLRQVSEKTVGKSYEYLENTINDALARIFKDRKRTIKIVETTRSNQYPQVEIELTTENGVIDIKSDGRGIGQILSFLMSICLIVLTGARRFMMLDEVINGLSTETLKVMDDIIQDFVSIGFVFLINEHSYIPSNSKVYELGINNGITSVKNVYFNENGVFLETDDESIDQSKKNAPEGSKTLVEGVETSVVDAAVEEKPKRKTKRTTKKKEQQMNV